MPLNPPSGFVAGFRLELGTKVITIDCFTSEDAQKPKPKHIGNFVVQTEAPSELKCLLSFLICGAGSIQFALCDLSNLVPPMPCLVPMGLI